MLYAKYPASIGLALLVVAAPKAQDNKLTADETSAGYDLLFNGVDLNNWHAYRSTKVTDAWTVKANAPLGARIENGNGTKLPILTNKKYMNFDLKIDVQVPVNGNSGVFARYEETALDAGNARSGPEMQICGPNHNDCAGPTKHLGSCYDMFGVKESIRTTWMNAPGTWNSFRIVAFDSNYVHYGNGKKLLEYKIGTAEFLKAYNESKYVSDGNNGRYYHIHTGSFLLQHHGEIGVTFKNIKARELTVHPFKQEFKDGKWPETLDQGFVFGKSPDGVAVRARETLPAIAVTGAGSDGVRLSLPFPHAEFHALGLDGKAMPFLREGDGEYALRRADGATGVVVVSARVGGHVQSRLVTLP